MFASMFGPATGPAVTSTPLRDGPGGVSIWKSALESMDPATVASALPMGQGVIYAAIRPVSSSPSRPSRMPAAPADDASLELGTLEELIALEAVGTPEARQRIYALLRSLGETLTERYPDTRTFGRARPHEADPLLSSRRTAPSSTAISKKPSTPTPISSCSTTRRFSPAAPRCAWPISIITSSATSKPGPRLLPPRPGISPPNSPSPPMKSATSPAAPRQIEAHRDRRLHSRSRACTASTSPRGAKCPPLLEAMLDDPAARDLWPDVATRPHEAPDLARPPSDDVAFELVDLFESRVRSRDNADSRAGFT
jgi:hypothetical protein